MGGVSNSPYKSLNTSYDVGDLSKNVTTNLSRIRETIGADHLISVKQTHGDGVVTICRDNLMDRASPSADALITNVPGVALMVKQADCQGVILFDPQKGVVANAHCGWRGSVQNVLGRVVARMEEDFGCMPTHIHAAIGPSLGPCCAEFITHEEIFPKSFRRFMVTENHFDLWAVSCHKLTESGLKEENIEVAYICTKCRPDLFFSYRAEGRTGRYGTVAMLR
jgi:YfiH family protein